MKKIVTIALISCFVCLLRIVFGNNYYLNIRSIPQIPQRMPLLFFSPKISIKQSTKIGITSDEFTMYVRKKIRTTLRS